MDWVLSVAGMVVVLVVLWDIFHTLWHPGGFGRMARGVFHAVWVVTRRVAPRRTRRLAGPLGILLTVASWTGLVVVGYMLVYLAQMPEGFHFGSSLRPGSSSDLVAAAYLSLVTVSTLGFGDIMPADPTLRLLVPFEALLGFVLLTAAISWILQIYPALGRRRSVSRRLDMLRSRGAADVVATGDPAVAVPILDSVTDGLVQAETDLLQYGESYYFVDGEEGLSLAATLPYAIEVAEAGERSSHVSVRFAAGMLAEAIENFASRLDDQYLRTGSAAVPDLLAAYADDHRIGVQP